MRCLRETAELEALRGAWTDLWARVPDATPFQHPAWLIPWWRHVGEGELLTFVLEEGGELVALFPFYLWRRRLFPLGIGTTDYLDALVAPGCAARAMAALMAALSAHRAAFDVAEWPQLRPASPLLLGAAPAGWDDARGGAEPCPVLALPASTAALRERVHLKTLRDLRGARKRAAELGAACELAEDATLDEFGTALLALHAARWQAREEEGVMAAEGVRRMHREAMPALQASGLLRLFGLRAGSDPAAPLIAVIHALADPPGRAERRLYLYLQGFDPAFERLSPGLLLLGHVVEHAIAEGFALADFLRGQERYKGFWGAVNTPTRRRVLTPPEVPA
jgi:CelD/BcsL family acetyltransferase involved in cellulose biosynthesis